MKSKTCKQCGEEKELTEYYRMPLNSDGRMGTCKVCKRAYATKHRGENLERIRAYDRARGARQSPEYQREWRRKNPEKARAHKQVARHLENPGACSECDSTYHIEAHHDDYSKPLDVRWLCAVCHKQHHARAG